MARRGFQIAFPGIERQDTGVHRVRNWAEDLFREITPRQWGTVEDMDRSTDVVWVIASSARMTGDLTKAIQRTLERHYLLDRAEIKKLSKAEDWREYEAFRSHNAGRRLTTR